VSVNVTASSSTITATATGTAVEAGVSSSTVSTSSSGGVGPQGPAGPTGPGGSDGDDGSSGVVSVVAPITNTGTSSEATIGLSYGGGLGVFEGNLIVFGVPQSSVTGLVDALIGKANASHAHGAITASGAIGTTSGRIVVTGASGVLTTAATISLSQISQSSATTGQVVAWNGTAWAPAAASGYTLPNATTSTLGGVIVGTGLGVASGTISVSFGTSSSTACVGNDARLSDSRTPLAHTHAIADVTSLQTTLDGKAASSHGHAIADVTGLQTALDGKQASGSYAAASHTHAVGDLTQSGATTNQVIQWNGSAWAPATVSGGGGGSTSASDLTSGTLNDARLSFVPFHPFLLMGG